jgi:hypothetical protein
VDDRLVAIGDSKRDTCQGDSGGPALALIDGVETIIGITSFGDVGCHNGGYDTRTDRYLAFIDRYISGAPSTVGKEREPNDRSDQANALSENAFSGTLDNGNDVDWLSFEMPAHATYVINLRGARASIDFHLYKAAPSGLDSIGTAETTEDGARQLGRDTASGGSYFIKIFDDDSAAHERGAYTLSLQQK